MIEEKEEREKEKEGKDNVRRRNKKKSKMGGAWGGGVANFLFASSAAVRSHGKNWTKNKEKETKQQRRRNGIR